MPGETLRCPRCNCDLYQVGEVKITQRYVDSYHHFGIEGDEEHCCGACGESIIFDNRDEKEWVEWMSENGGDRFEFEDRYGRVHKGDSNAW